MGGPPIYKVVKNRKVPSYLHAECVKPPQNWYFFLLMRLSGAGASRLSLPFQFALRTRKHNLVRLGEFANLVACAARPLWSAVPVLSRT